MGPFLKKYAESIYATRGGAFVAPDEKKRPMDARGFALPEGEWWGGSTHKGTAVYLHILRWPSDSIRLPAAELRVRCRGEGRARVQSGSRTFRMRSAGTFSNRCRLPLGHVNSISLATGSPPSPKWARLSLADK